MREIKFRAWDNHDHKMIYIEDDLRAYRGFEVMQFTGLHDRNGKEIYEGDAVRGSRFVNGPGDFVMQAGIVEWGRGYFFVAQRQTEPMVIQDLSDFQEIHIIGNIYENPELVNP